MDIKCGNRDQEIVISIASDPERIKVAQPPSKIAPGSWEDLAKEALDHPLDIPGIEKACLENKKICVMTDDWGRPTPAHRVLPEIVRRLEQAGAREDHIVFVTASGMHEPMHEEDIRRKLGEDIYNRFICVSHDAGDKEKLAFAGITQMGSPVWINKFVAEADYKIAVGRVYPHVCYGYEGGYKMVVPGVSSFETILRDHSLNFSPDSVYSVVGSNPSRREADEIGKLVGIDFLLNYVVDRQGQPMKAYAGSVETVFRSCVRMGEKNVWGTRVGKKFDITVLLSGKAADRGIEENPMYYLGQALQVTKDDGTVIALMKEEIGKNRNVIEGTDLDALSLSQLLMMHEKRDWRCNERQVQHYVKKLRSVFYEKRVMELHKQNLYIVSDKFSANKLKKYRAKHFTDVNAAIENALALYERPEILVIPEGEKTLPLVEYSFPDE